MTATATRPTAADILAGNAAPAKKIGGNFPAVADFKPNRDEGRKLVGEYLGKTSFPVPGAKPGEVRTATGHLWKLAGYSEGLPFILGKQVVTPKEGDTVSLSGAVLDRILDDSLVGKIMAVSLVSGQKSKFNNTTKVYEVEIFE